MFTAKCGECKEVHEYPKCNKCKTTRMQSGKCESCCYIKLEEEYYSYYCGNCFKRHALPNCVERQHYRLKPGKCTNCGGIGPDDRHTMAWYLSGWRQQLCKIDTTSTAKKKLGHQDEFKKAQDIWQLPTLQSDVFILQKHVSLGSMPLHFNDMKQQIQRLTQNLKNSQGKKPTDVLLHKATLQRKREVDTSGEEDTDEDGQPIFTFDKILGSIIGLSTYTNSYYWRCRKNTIFNQNNKNNKKHLVSWPKRCFKIHSAWFCQIQQTSQRIYSMWKDVYGVDPKDTVYLIVWNILHG